jgi:glutaminyl-tRNA synthetase
LERLAGGKPKGFLHWVSVTEAVQCEVRVYDLLFNDHDPNQLEDYVKGINVDSKIVYKNSQMHKYYI